MARGIWNGYISFGLINIPVMVQTAEQAHDLSFNMLDKKNLARIRFNRVNEKTGKKVEYGDIVKGYEYEKDQYVVLTDADFKRANPKANQTIEVQQFIPYEDIDPMHFEKPYYLVPNKGGTKSYFLFQRALQESGKVALATVVMHQKEHLTCIIARNGHLVLEMLRFAHEIKHPPEIKELDQEAKKQKPKTQELHMASQLVEQMTGKWKIDEFKDKFYLEMKKYIDKKIKSGQGKTITREEDVESVPMGATAVKDTDLMALLKKSLSGEPAAKKTKHHGSHAAHLTHHKTKRKSGGASHARH